MRKLLTLLTMLAATSGWSQTNLNEFKIKVDATIGTLTAPRSLSAPTLGNRFKELADLVAQGDSLGGGGGGPFYDSLKMASLYRVDTGNRRQDSLIGVGDAKRLRGRAIAASDPQSKYTLVFNGEQWVPRQLTGADIAGLSFDTSSLSSRIETAKQGAPHVFGAKTYGAKGDGIIGVNGVTSSGSTTFTATGANFATSDTGKYVKIHGAGAGGDVHVAKIVTRISSNAVTLSAPATLAVTGARFVYGTDDQAAINATILAAFNKGGTAFFPTGVYCIVGDLIHTDNLGNDPNSQLVIPSRAFISGSTPGTYSTVRLEGESAPANFDGPFVDARSNEISSGTIFESLLTFDRVAATSTTSYPAIIGTIGVVNQFGATNLTDVQGENIYTRSVYDVDSGKFMTGWNLSSAGNYNVQHCTDGPDVSVFRKMQDSVWSKRFRSVGFLGSFVNQGTEHVFENNKAIGNYINFSVSEHGSHNNNQSLAGRYGLDFQTGAHQNIFQKHLSHWDLYAISYGNLVNPYFAATSFNYVTIDAMTIERYPTGAMTFRADIVDPGNSLIGNMYFAGGTSLQSNLGNYSITKIGGQFFQCHHIAYARITNENMLYWYNQQGAGVWSKVGSDIHYSAGKVGIGTNGASSSNTLAVWDNKAISQSVDAGTSYRNLNSGGYIGPSFLDAAGVRKGQFFYSNASASFGGGSAIVGDQLNLISQAANGLQLATSTGPFVLATGGTAGTNIRMFMTAAGKAGFGTTNPENRIHLTDNDDLASSQFGGSLVENTNASGYANFKFRNSAGDIGQILFGGSSLGNLGNGIDSQVLSFVSTAPGGLNFAATGGKISMFSNAVGVNTSSPAAALDVTSTTSGFLPPRMTAAQASAISSPPQGTLLFVTTTNGTFTAIGWWGWNGTTWQQF